METYAISSYTSIAISIPLFDDVEMVLNMGPMENNQQLFTLIGGFGKDSSIIIFLEIYLVLYSCLMLTSHVILYHLDYIERHILIGN